jgi:hypothetical protein
MSERRNHLKPTVHIDAVPELATARARAARDCADALATCDEIARATMATMPME